MFPFGCFFPGRIEQSRIICTVNAKHSPAFAFFEEHIAGTCDCRSLVVFYSIIYNTPLFAVKYWLPFLVAIRILGPILEFLVDS